MLLSLTIKNVALVENQTISFYQGMHTLTGETGAGKSIIIDSLNLIMGGRADRDLIRSGCDKAFVEALFDVADNSMVLSALKTMEIETENGTISVSREISMNGKNFCRILGMVVPLNYVKEITPYLFDIHGQHQHQLLMDEKNHLSYVDAFGDDVHQQLIKDVSTAYTQVHEAGLHYQRLKKENAVKEQRIDMLRFQIDELQAAKLHSGEEEQLTTEKNLYRNQEKCSHAIESAYQNVYESALLDMKTALDAMASVQDLDSSYKQVFDKLNTIYYDVEDVGLDLRNLFENRTFDPARAEEMEERLDQLRKLERKYGPAEADLIAYLENIKAEYESLCSLDDTMEQLAVKYKMLLKVYRTSAAALSASRKSVAEAFSTEIEHQLSDLGMKSTKFVVNFIPPEEGKKPIPQPIGDDNVAFLIAPNPGEPLKPLAKTASGGELSRLMLAIKASNAKRCLTPCMIFDEIDTGISGYIAEVVAEKMAALGKYHQVICVTHLPQLTAMADYAYKVDKHVQNNRTVSNVTQLDDDGQVAEIARMIGGAGESSIVHAKSMFNAARAYKSKLTV